MSRSMSLDEFHDFVVDVSLETDNGAPYTFEMMGEMFKETNRSGKGLAVPRSFGLERTPSPSRRFPRASLPEPQRSRC